jgi:hypothetical protein
MSLASGCKLLVKMHIFDHETANKSLSQKSGASIASTTSTCLLFCQQLETSSQQLFFASEHFRPQTASVV